MNIFHFSEALTEALTYTLLHSLWQGLIIFMILKTAFLFVPWRKSQVRYALTGTSMLMMFCATLLTFFLSYNPVTTGHHHGSGARIELTGEPIVVQTSTNVLFDYISGGKEFISTIWLVGTILCSLRFACGYIYLQNLRRSAHILNNEWTRRIKDIACRLRVRSAVVLAESARVSAPVVVGFVKPFIIIPAGLSSGLSSDQLEAIFMHELVHIRRNDYIFNILQSLMEALFFFNPFVWIISSRLRTEREHCCDDAVVNSGADARAYVYALASLEEVRMASPLVLSLAGNKNELLQRIKRLMEKSVRNYSLREKVAPILFLIVGLICASWFSIQKETPVSAQSTDEKIVPADTSIRKKKQKSSTYSRKQTTVVTPDGVPKKETIEQFNVDEESFPTIEDFDFNMDLPIPPMPESEAMIPDMELMFPPFPPFELSMNLDTIPPRRHLNKDWKTFEEEFTRKFQEKFGDFYQKNEGEFQKMMKEFQQKFQNNHEWEDIAFKMHAAQLERHAQAMKEQGELMQEHQKHLQEAKELTWKLTQEQRAHELKEQREIMQEHQEELQEAKEIRWKLEEKRIQEMKKLEKNMKELEEKMHKFSEALKAELVKDGYIKSGESLENLHWDDNGDIEINGTKIKESDEKKYRELHEKYLGQQKGDFHFSE
jgi:bla regulator protein blaR1